MRNLFDSIPDHIEYELFSELVSSDSVRIERIVSKGHTSSEASWYDQEENEWVIVLQGSGEILFEDGERATLHNGDYINIPAHRRHKVSWTDPVEATVWLAVFYQ